MSDRVAFAIPCKVCGCSRQSSSHELTSDLFSQFVGCHVYVPDENSAEYVALKLREALEGLMSDIGVERWQVSKADAALSLADDAGIRSES